MPYCTVIVTLPAIHFDILRDCPGAIAMVEGDLLAGGPFPGS